MDNDDTKPANVDEALTFVSGECDVGTPDSEYDSSSEEYDSDVPADEIERMLEDALENTNTAANNRKRSAPDISTGSVGKPYEERSKIVLIEKCQNHFEVLPEGWIQITHNSGMPLYLHKSTRVCTMSRPYFLGPGSARKHEIPLSAIPCLNYSRSLERERAQCEAEMAAVTASGCAPKNMNNALPNGRIETIKENIEMHSLKADTVRNYCKSLFHFKTIRVMRFKSWSERRQFTKRRKVEKQLQRPNLPDGTKLITFPIQNNCMDLIGGGGSGGSSDTTAANDDSGFGSGGVGGGGSSGSGGGASNCRREWIMNPSGKSYVCILHEYVQHALKKQPTYTFTELENAATPYSAIVSINDMKYGEGFGTSKKQAKSEAARATLEILIPEMRTKILRDEKSGGSSASKDPDQDLSFFDGIRIEDPRVAEFCAKTTEPSPYDILLTCLQRNFGQNDLQINYQGNTLKNKKNQYTITVGAHTATVVCKNKRDGKQRASQAILQALHPNISSWGSLLRLYGSRSVKSFKEKKLEEQEITALQTKAAVNVPNFAILDKLKIELTKLRDKRQQKVRMLVTETDNKEEINKDDSVAS